MRYSQQFGPASRAVARSVHEGNCPPWAFSPGLAPLPERVAGLFRWVHTPPVELARLLEWRPPRPVGQSRREGLGANGDCLCKQWQRPMIAPATRPHSLPWAIRRRATCASSKALTTERAWQTALCRLSSRTHAIDPVGGQARHARATDFDTPSANRFRRERDVERGYNPPRSR